MSTAASTAGFFSVERADGETLRIAFRGLWRGEAAYLSGQELRKDLDRAGPWGTLEIIGAAVEEWDSAFLVVLKQISDAAAAKHATLRLLDLPKGIEALLDLAAAVPEQREAKRNHRALGFVEQLGVTSIGVVRSAGQTITFFGEVALALGALLKGRARFPVRDFWLFIDHSGPRALPIVTLISTLVGVILAFIGIVQLSQFGAQIYVANLVGIAMAREMGAVMVGVILAGRTGAAFAAQLGTMQVNEEIDALRTLGVSPLEYLVLPRMLALALMMPLLCLYADLLGTLGGVLIAVGAMGISPPLYISQTINAVQGSDIVLGLVKSAVFGLLVACAGCMRGMQSGRSASAVGEAATSAVVTAIVWIVITDAVFAFVTNVLGI